MKVSWIYKTSYLEKGQGKGVMSFSYDASAGSEKFFEVFFLQSYKWQWITHSHTNRTSSKVQDICYEYDSWEVMNCWKQWKISKTRQTQGKSKDECVYHLISIIKSKFGAVPKIAPVTLLDKELNTRVS